MEPHEYFDKNNGVNEATMKVLSWSLLPLLSLTKELSALFDYSELVYGSIDILTNDKVATKLAADVYSDEKNNKKFLEVVAAAKIEKEEQYPHFSHQHIIALFAYLEGGIKRIATGVLEHLPDTLNIEEVKDIKISLSEYMQKSDQERTMYLYEQYERKVVKGELYGVSRFEKILSPLGLGGSVTEDIRKHLFELGQVRNCIVHNSGRADRAIIERCQALNLKLNEHIAIDIHKMHQFHNAVTGYLVALMDRMVKRVIDLRLVSPDVANILQPLHRNKIRNDE